MSDNDAAAEFGTQTQMSLANYRPHGFSPGRPAAALALWYVVNLLVFESGWFPWYGLKRWLLRQFGASLGHGAVIKPHVRIKYPWRLRLGNHCWIGEDVWIDNLAEVEIGSDVCLSQGVYLCTGSHDHRRPTFDLITRPIVIEDQVWVAARALILPGVRIGRGAVIAAGSVVTQDVAPAVVIGGCPGRVIGDRNSAV
jgi:putative colanic acid biosynthesis acetyltransferase WcaF